MQNVLFDTVRGDTRTIDGMVVGGTTQAAGSFTTLTATGLIYESATDGITAGTTQTQAGATQLVAEINRVTVNATAGNGVKLPASMAGLDIIVVNATAKPIAVYGFSASDTINGGVAGTSVSQMPNSTVLYCCTLANSWFTEGLGSGFAGSLQTLSYADGLVSTAGVTGTFATTSATITCALNPAGFAIGSPVLFSMSLGGTLPTSFIAGETYYVSATGFVPGTSFQLSSTLANAIAGTSITNGASAGTGTFTFVAPVAITTTSARFTTSVSGGAGILPTAAAGLGITVINGGAYTLTVYPQSTDAINATFNGSYLIPPGGVVEFFTTAATSWHTLPAPSPLSVAYQTSAATTGFTATGANVASATNKTYLNLTGTLGAGATVTLPSVAVVVAAMQAAGLNPLPGQTWEFELQNNSSASFSWTLAVDSGNTWGASITGTTSAVAKGVAGRFLFTLTSLAAGTVRTLGQFTTTAAP